LSFPKVTLQERIALIKDGLCAHDEYVFSLIHQFVSLPVPAYFRGAEEALARVEYLLDMPHEEVAKMTYQQLVRKLDVKFYYTMTGADDYLYEAIENIAVPLIKTRDRLLSTDQLRQAPIVNAAPQRISLDERLGHNSTALEDCLLCCVEVEGLLLFLESKYNYFGYVYDKYFQKYGERTFMEVIRNSGDMPEQERHDVQYHLLVDLFSRLNPEPFETIEDFEED
jgi:hypothetical protein